MTLPSLPFCSQTALFISPAVMPPNHRRCISCRKAADREFFWRIVRVFPAKNVELDQGMGRSAYLCPQASCLQAAQKKDRLGRALKAAVPEEIYQTLWHRLSTTATIERSDRQLP
ncbi:MAG TPA: YlxR family protein [Trichocoleus sp.]|jgi:predicted RNA-binding protein YlxR (DUF448 family)